MNAGISRDTSRSVSVCVCYLVCVCVLSSVCGGVSLLSISSGQHKSDMTFPQDVKLREMGVTAGGL